MAMSPPSLKKQIQKLLSRTNQTEAQIEQDLLDLFRETLGFDSESSERQFPCPTVKGNIDILLRPDKNTDIIVEIKKPIDFRKDQYRSKAIRQACRYMIGCNPRAEFGIASDGRHWIMFSLRPYANYYMADRLLSFDLHENVEVASAVLSRCKKTVLKGLFTLLRGIHGRLQRHEFESIMDLGLDERVNALAARASQNGFKTTGEDRKLIRLLYKGGSLPVDQMRSIKLGEPVKVTRSK